METFDGTDSRKRLDRRLSGSPADTGDRRKESDRRRGIDRRSVTDRRSPNGFRAIAGMGRRKKSPYPPLFDFQAPSESVLTVINAKEN